MSSEKKFKTKTLYHDSKDSHFTWGELLKVHEKIGFEPNDVIDISYQEAFYSENNSWDAHYLFSVERDVLETDEEFQKRLKSEEFQKEDMRKRRYENYLRLKKEFEPKEEE